MYYFHYYSNNSRGVYNPHDTYFFSNHVYSKSSLKLRLRTHTHTQRNTKSNGFHHYTQNLIFEMIGRSNRNVPNHNYYCCVQIYINLYTIICALNNLHELINVLKMLKYTT